ncbi:anthocyanidin 3-O-glucosyltransferase 2-like [Andrographis paniculata]|uniref:Glycosyltransferase n=1 Tax=Andrographis paniculata TaxID=175694 RepID=A0A3G1S2T9_ANDPA|nr:anthocyanidin 3-O-glucosyltransferase 2-like [Andrographis paniculata]AXL95239.1 UDP-glycosyltransferase [Andrographis paniculata]
MSQPIELVFIPSPGLSHVISTVEAAKLLLARGGDRLTVTVVIVSLPDDENDKKEKMLSDVKATIPRLRFIDLPYDHNAPGAESPAFRFTYILSCGDKIKQLLSDLIEKPSVPGSRLVGLVLDMFCTNLIQVGNELSIPSYVFYTAGAFSLGVYYDIVSLKFEQNQDLTQYKDSDTKQLSSRCASQPIPAKIFPLVFVDGNPFGDIFLEFYRKFVDAKGVLINTFYELEPYAVDSLSAHYKNYPKVYPIGPVLKDNPGSSGNPSVADLMKWLDDQPDDSVVFLCFGSMGALEGAQVREFAKALEGSGSRFVWSLRKPTASFLPSEYGDYGEVLPEGFLERTAGRGRVIGWAPQVAVLAHAAVGGFVSHCGWNSVLESVWQGVPVAALPLYAEQQINAFELVRELGMTEEIKIDYRIDLTRGGAAEEIVPAGEIEAAIRRLMAADGGARGKVKEMQRKSREVLKEDGSSYASQMEFLQDVLKNAGLE